MELTDTSEKKEVRKGTRELPITTEEKNFESTLRQRSGPLEV